MSYIFVSLIYWVGNSIYPREHSCDLCIFPFLYPPPIVRFLSRETWPGRPDNGNSESSLSFAFYLTFLFLAVILFFDVQSSRLNQSRPIKETRSWTNLWTMKQTRSVESKCPNDHDFYDTILFHFRRRKSFRANPRNRPFWFV